MSELSPKQASLSLCNQLSYYNPRDQLQHKQHQQAFAKPDAHSAITPLAMPSAKPCPRRASPNIKPCDDTISEPISYLLHRPCHVFMLYRPHTGVGSMNAGSSLMWERTNSKVAS